MSKAKYIVGLAMVVAALGATPLVISQKINQAIEENRLFLEKNGLKQVILSNKGYLEGHKEFVLEIVDAKKIRDFIFDAFAAKNPQYQPLVQTLKNETNTEIGELNGIEFKGQMTHSNLFPKEVAMTVCLNKLPDNLQYYRRVASFAEKGVLCLDMTLNTAQQVTNVKLHDIKDKLKFGGEVFDVDDKQGELLVDFDLKSNALSLDHKGDVLQGLMTMGYQNVSIDNEMIVLKSELKNLAYRFDYKDELNNKGDLAIDSYTLVLQDDANDFNMSLGKVAAKSSVDTLQKELSAKADYQLNNISMLDGLNDIIIDKLALNVFLRGIETSTMKKLQADYNTLVIGTTPIEDKVLIADFVALINHGVKLDFGVKLQGANTDMLQLKDTSMDLSFDLPANQYNDQQSPLEILGLLDVSAKLKIHKDDKAMFEDLGLTDAGAFALGKVEGDFLSYDIAMKKGVISVNGKAIQ